MSLRRVVRAVLRPCLNRRRLQLAALVLGGLLAACGGGGGGNGTPPPTVLTGQFIDSAVIGIGYETPTRSGVTGPNGEFEYLAGEQVTFFIGALRFPSAVAQPIVTPLALAGTASMADQEVVNIARLLMSIDANGNPDDGITIPAGASSIATAIEFDVPVAEFATAAVTGFVDALDGDAGSGALRTEAEALAHLGQLIAGTYRTPGPSPDVLVLFADGEFIYTESAGEPTNGVDAGTYVTDPIAGTITFTITFETNTSGGLADGIGATATATAALTVAGDLTLDGGYGAVTLQRALVGTDLAGTWRFDASLGGTLVFFDDGQFIYVEAAPDDPTSGLEAGTYVYDAGADTITFHLAFSENPNGGIWEADGPSPTTGLWFDREAPGTFALGDSWEEAGIAYREGGQ